ncbi:MAG TPA: type II secretion system F family protein [archaeon]|nr:type II secretion system F family protein [archaeon]
MALNLIQNSPVLKNNSLFQKYATYLYSIEFKVDPLLWIILSILTAIIASILTWYFVGNVVGLEQDVQLGLLVFLVALDGMLGYPYIKALQRIDLIEEDLPDALRQMADTLRSGGTYEYALREVANSEYGPLKKEMNEVLRKLEEGENFENALRTLTYNVDSKVVRRTVNIIIDSVAAGAGLATVLEEIAEDLRETHRISKERKSRTVLQVIFMFTAGALISPLIFGFVSTISNVLINAAAGAVSEAAQADAKNSLGILEISIQAYIFIETIATSIMISVMREGNASKSIIYIPILLSIAYIAYLAAALISGALVGVG